MELVVSTADWWGPPRVRHPFEFTSRCASVPVMHELGSEFSIEVAIRRDGAKIATFDISLDGEEWVTLKTTTSGTATHKLKTRTVETSEYSVTVDIKVRTDDEHVEASMLLRTIHIMERSPPSEAAAAADATAEIRSKLDAASVAAPELRYRELKAKIESTPELKDDAKVMSTLRSVEILKERFDNEVCNLLREILVLVHLGGSASRRGAREKVRWRAVHMDHFARNISITA